MKHILKILILFFFVNVFAQETKNVSNQKIIWYTYNANYKFNEKWFSVTDIQERQFINPSGQHLWAIRETVRRNINDQWDIGSGVSYFYQKTNNPEVNSLAVPEIRGHIECNSKQNLWLGTIIQRYRVEARYFQNTQNKELSSGYSFRNIRFRYLVGYNLPILKDKETSKEILLAKFQDEVMINTGGKIVQNTFDQNRIYIALNYAFTKKISLEAGYLSVFQQQTKAGDFYDRDILRLTLFHKLN